MIWIDYCSKMRKGKGQLLADAEMKKFFNLLKRSELYISKKVGTKICNYYGEGEAKIAKVFSINNDFSSKCQHCGFVLDKFLVDDDDRARIMQILIDFVIKKHDIYLKSSPVEFEKFRSFLDDKGQFDLVVDQPNVSFKPLPPRHSNLFNQSRNLYESVKHFTDLGWSTLLICRPEVRRFPHYRQLVALRSVLCDMSSAKVYKIYSRAVSLYILDANTNDDLFLLLAALHSGNHCQILSNDYFRQHLHQIGKT